VLGLEDLANPDNVGGAFRNALAFGADVVLLSRGSADPLSRKAIRVSVGSALRVPFAAVDDWGAGLRQLRAAGYAVVALTPDRRAVDIAELGAGRPRPARLALLVGSEDRGLRPESLAAADLAVRIPTCSAVDSLNAATAVGIALYRLAAADRAAGAPT
jgi:tRNA G18 (ribose-2'-O)-methylase SpoU